MPTVVVTVVVIVDLVAAITLLVAGVGEVVLGVLHW
jgi:hypothetical protein